MLGIGAIVVIFLTVSVALITNNWMRQKRFKKQEAVKE
jgi:hypothetical protein